MMEVKLRGRRVSSLLISQSLKDIYGFSQNSLQGEIVLETVQEVLRGKHPQSRVYHSHLKTVVFLQTSMFC